MPKFRVETGTGLYRICCDDNEGPLISYGDAATLVIGAAVYYCLIADPDKDQPNVMRVDQVSEMTTEYEDVNFEGDEEADQETDDEEESEEDEDESVLVDDDVPE